MTKRKYPYLIRNELITCDCVLSQLIDNVNTGQVDCIVQSFTNFVYDCASSAFSKKRINGHFQQSKPKTPWFDEKCNEARNQFKHARNQFLKNKSDINRQNFISSRSKYIRTKSTAKKKIKMKEGQEVCNMAKSKPKQFWKTIKKKFTYSKSVQSDSLTVDDLFHHFKSIYGIESNPLSEQPLDAPPTETQENSALDVEISENELKMPFFLRKITKVRVQLFYVLNYLNHHLTS